MKPQHLILFFAIAVMATPSPDYVSHTTPNPSDHLSLLARAFCQGTCVSCYGPNMIQCVGSSCYDPTAGESCCTDGTYCPAGKYCSSNPAGYCCDEGQSPEACAIDQGFTLEPATTTGSDDVSTTTPSPAGPTTTDDSPESTITDVPVYTSTAVEPTYNSTTPTYTPPTIKPTGSQTTTGGATQFTGAASALGVGIHGGVAVSGVGVLGLLFML